MFHKSKFFTKRYCRNCMYYFDRSPKRESTLCKTMLIYRVVALDSETKRNHRRTNNIGKRDTVLYNAWNICKRDTMCSKMYEGIYLVFMLSLCIFVDILTVCYTFIHFL